MFALVKKIFHISLPLYYMSNFKDFNDAVLRAALLRASTEQEMNYVLDDLLSAEMLDLLGKLG